MSRRNSKNLKSQRDSSKCGRRGVVKCPFCGYEAYVNCFKLLREPWRYWFYEVKRLECPKCENVFMWYEGVSPRGKYVVFAIRERRRDKTC
ncbi:MAG: hypothetical protein QXR68_02520 [Pyrobaculum sp.]